MGTTETTPLKWEGTHDVKVNGVSAEKIWSAVSDFCNVNKWFPNLDTCHRVEGSEGEPGLIRYCASTKENEKVSWAKERLVKIDHIGRCLSYEIMDNNVGFKSYVATVTVLRLDGGDEATCGDGSRIVWSFVSDPVDGWRKEDLGSYVDFCIKHMAKKMETYFLNA